MNRSFMGDRGRFIVLIRPVFPAVPSGSMIMELELRQVDIRTPDAWITNRLWDRRPARHYVRKQTPLKQ
jgi:hypothetical protein